VGLPGTSGFVGEFLALIGTFKANIPVAIACHDRRDPVGLLRVVALYRKVVFGALTKPQLMGLKDMGPREIFCVRPRLVVLTILFGVYPKPVLDMSAASVAPASGELQSGSRAEEGG